MKTIKKFAALALVFAVLLTASACGKTQKTVMEYEGSTLTAGMFSYGLSLNKTQVLYNITYGVTDNPELWAYDTGGGKTIGEAVMENYIENCKLILIADAELRRLGIKETAANESALEDMYQAEVSAQGSVANLKIYLADYGVNVEGMKEYHRLATKFFDLLDHYYGEKGVEKLTEKQYYDSLVEDNALVQHILYKTFREIEGSTQTEEFTEDEVAELKEKVEAKVAQITDGEKTYDDFIEENEDSYLEYLVAPDSNFVQEFKDAAKEMEIGDVKIVKSQFGFHVMRKVEMNEEKYAEFLSEENENSSTKETVLTYRARLEQDSLYERLKEKLDGVVLSADEIAKFSVASAPVIK